MASSTLEEYELLGDAKYRSFIGAVDKALKSFEYTSEWADLISALGKLNKVLLSHLKFSVIPRRITISKRLAQCMHPALPSGVHLKALETYDIIFKCIGTARLSQELFIYSAGLFPLLGHAAMNVRPVLLTIYENHFVPLGERLRPGLNGFLIGVLPGMEEGSDCYDRTDALLMKVCESVEKSYFYGCLWRCILSNATIQLPAITFVTAHFDKKLSMEDQLFIIGTEIDAMVQGMSAALQVNNVLVQRSALDLLILGFPMHNSQLVHSDMVKIVTSAITVVLRRDMSLNRRLFAWLLGSEIAVPPEQILPEYTSTNSRDSVSGSVCDSGFNAAYFDFYSKNLLLEALQICFEKPFSLVSLALKNQNMAFAELWPYRILISLLDRPEISYGILDDILIYVFRSVYKEVHLCDSSDGANERKQKSGKSQDKLSRSKAELIKNVNLLFDTLESYYLWEYIGKLYAKACEASTQNQSSSSQNANGTIVKDRIVGDGSPSIEELCTLVSFLLDVINVETYTDTPSEHLPDLLNTLGSLMIEHCSSVTLQELAISFQLCSKVLSKVQPATLRSDELSCHSGESRSRLEATPNAMVPFTEEEMEMQSTFLCMPSPSSDDLDVLPPQTVVSRCVATFQEFLCKFVKVWLLQEPESVRRAFLLLLVPSDGDSVRQRNLENLLQQCVNLRNDQMILEDRKDESLDDLLDSVQLTCIRSDAMSSTFQLISQFMVELASFPVLCNSVNLIPANNGLKEESTQLPEWMQLVLVLSCFTDDEKLSAIALQIVLDLISITKSALKATEKSLDRPKELVTEVLMVPMIHPSELFFVWHKTFFFGLAATRLWRQIGNSTAAGDQLRIVELLQQVHNLAPDDTVCDSVICKTLVTFNAQNLVNSQKKFCILWHLTRDLRLKTGSSRPFDRPLFLMFDNLRRETGPEKTIAEGWLNHCLQRGDIPRILEPILMILLHPDSARVSVQHISICCPKKKKSACVEDTEESTIDTQIYAISSIGGNVIYHVNDESRQSSRTTSPDRRILALTSLIPSDSHSSTKTFTCNSMLNDYELPCSHERTISSPISVFVNPFGSMTSLNSDFHQETTSVPDFSNVKRMNYKDSRRASFDDSDGESEGKKRKEESIASGKPDEEKGISTEKLQGTENAIEVVDEKESSFERSMEKEILVVNSNENECSTETKEKKESVIEEYVKELLNDIITAVIEGNISTSDVTLLPPGPIEMDDVFGDLDKVNTKEERFNKVGTKTEDSVSVIHPLHTYLLLFCQVYDSQRTLYALRSFQSVVLTNSRVALWSMATTSINNPLSYRSQELQVLLAKHRKSVFGNNFHGDMSNEAVTMYRSNMLLEVVVTTCLYYVRSFYPNLPQVRLTEEEVLGNQRVRLLSIEVLTLVFSELIGIVRDSGKSFASYLRDLLSRCKVQKIVLHCLIAAVYNSQQKKDVMEEDKNPSFSKVIVDFNEKNSDGDGLYLGNSFQDTLEVLLIRLLSTLIILEDTVSKYSAEETLPLKTSESRDKTKSNQQFSVKYNQGLSIPLQPMFLTTVLNAFRQKYKSHLHIHWLALVMTTLPFIGQSLKHLVVSIVSQLCLNLDMLAQQCQNANSKDDLKENDITPDYIITLIEGLTTICHYCLLDNPTPINTIQFPSFPSQSYASVVNASQILSNLIHAFSTSGQLKEQGVNGENSKILEGVLAARRTLLSNLPRILNTMANLWQIVSLSDRSKEVAASPKKWWIMGSPRAVRQHILSFLSPISVNHGSHFMAAVAVVWHDHRHKGNVPLRKIIPPYSKEQLLLVELIGAIKVLPMESIVQTVRQVIRQPPVTSADRNQKRVPVEVNMLQFFLAYMQNSLGNQLMESWNSLLSLWRDGLQLSSLPSVQFHLLALLHEFVQKTPLIEDKKSLKELQEVAQKLIDACSVVAGSSLEQTTWLRRNLAVKPGPQQSLPDDNEYFDKSEESTSSQPSAASLVQNAQYSVQALHVLAEFLAPVLDVVYASEEKEKMVSLLYNIMYYVTPYLRNHSFHNAPSFRACCQLLASISGYQYTRKAWKKDAFELLLDPTFFQMDSDCMIHWTAIIDHLMTHDKTTFRDFLARVYMPQSGSLNLFSSKEQEYELRAQLLKRLAFVIFCSEPDQYQKYMPDIQERLADCLRLPQVPSVQSNIFLCFRVLLLRMSAEHITSLWPVIITEMVQVFLQMEQELSTDTEEFRRVPSSHIRRLSSLDSSWVVSSHNGLHAHNHPVWLQLYLAVCKLLDMVICLPEDMLPQFQMYRWAFVADSPPISSDGKTIKNEGSHTLDPNFVPHIVRLATLMNLKVPNAVNGHHPRQPPLLNVTSLDSLMDLHAFFATLANCNGRNAREAEDGKCSHAKPLEGQALTGILKKLECVLEADFIEPRLAR